MLLIKIDRSAGTPIYSQIISQLIELIDRGTLQSGDNLPSTRSFAKTLGIDRSSVYRAYEELWALGYIESSPGSYTRIRKRPKIVMNADKKDGGMINWNEVVSPSSARLYQEFKSFRPEYSFSFAPGSINLSQLDMDSRLFPEDRFRKCMTSILLREGSKVLEYCAYAGYQPLREYIARRSQVHGINVSADEILITNGSQNAIESILKLLTVPRSTILVEEPTYANLIPLLRFYKVEVIGIPMREEGMDLEQLETYLSRKKAAFLYTIPNFHNPTGITTSQSHREALLSIAEKYFLPIVEDGFEEEMKYFGKVPLPVKSMDKKQVVIYLGTFSKVLMPGVRIGWVAADKNCIDRLIAIKRFCDISSNSVTQAAIYEFCRLGYYDLHIKKMHRVYRKRMQIALHSLKKYIKTDQVSWNEPSGGYLIWIRMNPYEMDDSQVEQIFIRNGVLVSPGEYYFCETNPHKYFRISIASLNEDEIEEGIKRLGEALNEIY